MTNRNKIILLGLLAAIVLPVRIFAAGTVTGYLQGINTNYGAAPATYNLITDDETVLLPVSSTTFEGGADNQTTYECSYQGSLNKVTSATCTIKTAALKGYLKTVSGARKIVSASGSSDVVANLPNGTSFPNGEVEGAYYICQYSGTLPNPNGAECDINQVATPGDDVDTREKPITRLFSITGCAKGQELICWTSKVYSWSQTALLISAVGAFVIAGMMYMTSGGNPQMIGKSKKIMIGALSGVAVIVLGRFFLTKVIGVPWL